MIVTKNQTALGFVGLLRYTSDVRYSWTEKIVLITNNLNTYLQASLKVFPMEEACRMVESFEWHYISKHDR